MLICISFGSFLTKPVHNIPFHVLTENLEKERETGIERQNEGRKKSEELIDKGNCHNENKTGMTSIYQQCRQT